MAKKVGGGFSVLTEMNFSCYTVILMIHRNELNVLQYHLLLYLFSLIKSYIRPFLLLCQIGDKLTRWQKEHLSPYLDCVFKVFQFKMQQSFSWAIFSNWLLVYYNHCYLNIERATVKQTNTLLIQYIVYSSSQH